MIVPGIRPRAEEAGQLARDRIDACEIGPFAEIAVGTRKGEVLSLIGTAVLASNDVFAMEGDERKRFRIMAVLAASAGAIAHQPDDGSIHHAAAWPLRASIASAFSTLTKRFKATKSVSSCRSASLSVPSVLLLAR